MDEVDPGPIESVQAAILLLEEPKQLYESEEFKVQLVENAVERPLFINYGQELLTKTVKTKVEIDEEELEVLQKELAGCKVQLEAKESAYMQALLKLQHYDERTEELSSQLTRSELERDVSMEELQEAQSRLEDIEYELKETTTCLSEATDANKKLLNELKAMQDEQLSMEAVIAQERESKDKAINRAKEMENLANVEKEKMETLFKHVEELEETIHVLKMNASEAETENIRILSEKDAKVELATSAALKMQEELDRMERRLDFTQELETQVFAKSMTIESLQSDLKESNLTISSLKEDVTRATKYAEELRRELEKKEREISDRSVSIEMLVDELNQLKLEVAKSNGKGIQMIHEMHKVRKEYRSAEIELSEFKDRATRAQVEIATLKAELHKTRSKLAAAEAAAIKAEGVRSGLYLAVQKLAMEVEEVENENQRLKQTLETEEETPDEENPTSHEESSDHAPDEAREEENVENEEEAQITISLEEYEALTAKAKKADEIPAQPVYNAINFEVEILKRDLEVAQAKVGEFRTRVVQAITRAEAAERAQASAEDQLRSWRERKQRRKAAMAALLEESVSRESPIPPYEESSSSAMSTPQTPLGMVLNMRS